LRLWPDRPVLCLWGADFVFVIGRQKLLSIVT
jgi:hypothetical protein